jgi:cob(I)alamin adenosyltransferase
VQVYTGEGKGKTTAALGLALRAAGAGLRVYIAQFAKGRRCSEHAALERFSDLITVRRFGRRDFIVGKPGEQDIDAARKGLDECRSAIRSGGYDVVVLDEINVAVHLGLIAVDELVEIIDSRPEGLELVITGRCAHTKVLDRADLITEMCCVKHYHAGGAGAREGIEY